MVFPAESSIVGNSSAECSWAPVVLPILLLLYYFFFRSHGRRITWHQAGKSFPLPNKAFNAPVCACCLLPNKTPRMSGLNLGSGLHPNANLNLKLSLRLRCVVFSAAPVRVLLVQWGLFLGFFFLFNSLALHVVQFQWRQILAVGCRRQESCRRNKILAFACRVQCCRPVRPRAGSQMAKWPNGQIAADMLI